MLPAPCAPLRILKEGSNRSGIREPDESIRDDSTVMVASVSFDVDPEESESQVMRPTMVISS
jgi:hypothetical protein